MESNIIRNQEVIERAYDEFLDKCDPKLRDAIMESNLWGEFFHVFHGGFVEGAIVAMR